MAGHHVVVSTSTASGKSLCYALPVLEALAADRSACAIFMFPTKALAQVGIDGIRSAAMASPSASSEIDSQVQYITSCFCSMIESDYFNRLTNVPLTTAIYRGMTLLQRACTRVAQDQRRALQEMCDAAFGAQAPGVEVYDGDTAKVICRAAQQRWSANLRLQHVILAFHVNPAELKFFTADAQHDKALNTLPTCPLAFCQGVRGETRDRAQLLITNPDMLHCSVLPVHRQFSRILAHLRYVIVDEGHAYRYPLTYAHLPPVEVAACHSVYMRLNVTWLMTF